MRIMLAPMEGVVDHEMRAVLTSLGGFDRCVTEFIRITEQVLPNRVFFRMAPELKQGGVTPSGVPVYLQLLGSSPKFMALNAQRAAKLSPCGIDLNFGCPSKTVNNNDGGSALLREPERIGQIVAAVRDAVDPKIPVTAKIRLGYSHSDCLDEIVGNIVASGATELCIHARTREDRYKPPAYWSAVQTVSSHCPIPIIINGEIWTIRDAQRARQQSQCVDIMLGRGALSCPDLATSIKAHDAQQHYAMKTWTEVLAIIDHYLRQSQNRHPKFVGNRAKQWLVFLQRQYPEAAELFQRIKRLKETPEIFAAMGR